LVRRQFVDPFPGRFEPVARRLDHHLTLGVPLDPTLPSVIDAIGPWTLTQAASRSTINVRASSAVVESSFGSVVRTRIAGMENLLYSRRKSCTVSDACRRTSPHPHSNDALRNRSVQPAAAASFTGC